MSLSALQPRSWSLVYLHMRGLEHAILRRPWQHNSHRIRSCIECLGFSFLVPHKVCSQTFSHILCSVNPFIHFPSPASLFRPTRYAPSPFPISTPCGLANPAISSQTVFKFASKLTSLPLKEYAPLRSIFCNHRGRHRPRLDFCQRGRWLARRCFLTNGFKVASPMPAVAPTMRAVGMGRLEFLYEDTVTVL